MPSVKSRVKKGFNSPSSDKSSGRFPRWEQTRNCLTAMETQAELLHFDNENYSGNSHPLVQIVLFTPINFVYGYAGNYSNMNHFCAIFAPESVFFIIAHYGGYGMAEEPDCVFCDIVAGQAPAHKIYEDTLSMCILDIHPYTKGHCLVISKRHVPWWHELNDEENTSLFKTAKIVADKMMHVLKPDFVFLYARGRRIPHTHLFLIPTYSGDVLDRFFNALENFQESPQMLATLKTPDEMEDAARLLKF